jgi:hypothetical protein
MPGPAVEHHLVPAYDFNVQVRAILQVRHLAETDVELAASHHPLHLAPVAKLQVHVQQRVGAQQLGNGDGSGHSRGQHAHGDREFAYHLSFHKGHLALEIPCGRDDELGTLQQRFAELRQHDLGCVAIEKHHAQGLFERVDAARKRRLRKMGGGRRAPEAAVSRQGQCVVQLPQFDLNGEVAPGWLDSILAWSPACGTRVGSAAFGAVPSALPPVNLHRGLGPDASPCCFRRDLHRTVWHVPDHAPPPGRRLDRYQVTIGAPGGGRRRGCIPGPTGGERTGLS